MWESKIEVILWPLRTAQGLSSEMGTIHKDHKGSSKTQSYHLTLVIDAHIVGGNVDMLAALEAKIENYLDNSGIIAAIK